MARFWKYSYWTQNVYFDFLYKFCSNIFLLEEEMSKIWSKMYIGLHVKYPLHLSDFIETWIFSTDFPKNIQISSSLKIRPVGEELFHADRHDEPNSHISQFCKRALKYGVI